jgi:hypothetical protein
LSAPSSQLHLPPQVPKHADRIEGIDGSRTCHTTVIVAKVERPGHTQLYLFVVLIRASLSYHMDIAALVRIVLGYGILGLVQLEYRCLRQVCIHIRRFFGFGSRGESSLGFP